jgi:glycosyltransferase involved in cell wall biosynthesis
MPQLRDNCRKRGAMNWWILFIAGWIPAVCWMAAGILTIRFFHEKTLAKCARAHSDPVKWPKVSVIIAARDEARSIETTLRSIANQDYPNFEVISVDDRSVDGTDAIIERVAAEESRIKAMHIRQLPEGWLGKCHALHQGALQASGELLLFADGDVCFASETLRLAVRYLLANRFDHLVLCPGLISKSYWEAAIKSFFIMILIMSARAWAAPKRSKNVYIGAGAFNLVRRTAYEDIGGHGALRREVIDDIMLGRLIKLKGYRQDILVAQEYLELSWLEGVRGFVMGLEKNAFAALDFSILRLLLATGLIFFFYVVPYIGVLAFQDDRIFGYGITVAVMHATFGFCAKMSGKGWRLLPALPAALTIFLWTLWRSALVTLRRGGVLWRDTFYPIRSLKKK